MQARRQIEEYTSQAAMANESLGQLLTDLANQSAGLVRDEVALAKQELSEKVEVLKSSLVLIGAGAAVGLVAALALAAALVVGLAEYVGTWQAAALVGGILAVVAGVLVFVGVGRIKSSGLKPEQTIETLEEDKEWLKKLT
jgi:uncharacterized membrane protein YqjE